MVGPKMSVKEQMQHVAAQNTFLPYDKIFFSSRWINIQARSAQGIQQLRPNRKHINNHSRNKHKIFKFFYVINR